MADYFALPPKLVQKECIGCGLVFKKSKYVNVKDGQTLYTRIYPICEECYTSPEIDKKDEGGST